MPRHHLGRDRTVGSNPEKRSPNCAALISTDFSPSSTGQRKPPRWGDRIVAGGRHLTPDRGPKTSLCWLEGNHLEEFAELPSGGDNSYPGFIELSHHHALVAYYSSHERDPAGKIITAIYLADLTR